MSRDSAEAHPFAAWFESTNRWLQSACPGLPPMSRELVEASMRSLESGLTAWYHTSIPPTETPTGRMLAHLGRMCPDLNTASGSTDYTAAAHTCAGLLGEAQQTAQAVFVNRAAALCEDHRPAPSLRSLFELWSNCNEHAYLDCVSNARFASAAAGLVNALLEDQIGDANAAASETTGPQRHECSHEGNYSNAPGVSCITGCIEPAAALRELEGLGERLNASVDALRRLGNVALGTTPRDVIHRDGRLRLYHYRPRTAQTTGTPLLIVYALVNRPYILDLQPDRSTIARLLDAGMDVYLIDWGYPVAEDRSATLDTYVNGYIDTCVDRICEQSQFERIDLLGVCQGGTLGLCYAATHTEKVRKLVPMVTPVDFHTPDNLLSSWVRELNADALVRKFGNLPGQVLNQVFLAMRPLRNASSKYLGLLDMVDDDSRLENFLRMERWIHDCPDQAGEAFKEFVALFFQRNALVSGTFCIGDTPVSLHAVDAPVFNVYATHDHIVPPAASRALRDHIPARNYSELAVPTGHIGMYVSDDALKTVPAAIAGWLRQS